MTKRNIHKWQSLWKLTHETTAGLMKMRCWTANTVVDEDSYLFFFLVFPRQRWSLYYIQTIQLITGLTFAVTKVLVWGKKIPEGIGIKKTNYFPMVIIQEFFRRNWYETKTWPQDDPSCIWDQLLKWPKIGYQHQI